MTALMGIDLGTGSVKVIVVDESGQTIGNGAAEHPLHHSRQGWSEQHPDDWWRATVAAVSQATAAAGQPRIDAIGLSGQMHGAVLLDEHRIPLRPAIIWADTRSGAEVVEITQNVGAERLIEIAGSPVAAGFQAASVAWIQRHEPELWRRVRTILLPKDWLRLQLTGELTTEPSDASSTLLFNVVEWDWSDEILTKLNIDRALLPEVSGSGDVSGRLATDPALELGLEAGIPVAGGGADAPLAALAAGVVRPDQMALTISSGSQVIVPLKRFVPDVRGRIHTWGNCLPNSSVGAAWYHMGATMVSGSALRWLRYSIFCMDEANAYAVMTAAAAEASVGAGGLLFLPYLSGERTPHMNPNARGMFLGLTAEHGRGHLVRAVMEGATFALFDAFDVLRSLGSTPTSVVLCGGGAQSPLWRQIVADVFGLAVKPLLTVEQSALGAALLAGACLDLFDPAIAAQQWGRYDRLVEPNPEARATYSELLPVFRSAYAKHIADFDTLSRIGSVGASTRL